ncbi:MAG: hypothetical protein ACI85K_000504 [Hyphomicrobiaceae bacterium]|jgi:hypothetical protein
MPNMMGAACRRNLVATSLIVLLTAACNGGGSDIGPRLPRISDTSEKVQLFDDQNRGVVSGRVTVVGTTTQALTGRNGRGDFLASPRGDLVIRADGSNGAATAGDRLGTLQVAMTVTGTDLPAPIHLPDLPDSASALLATSVASPNTVITSVGGTIVTVSSGVIINSGPTEPVTVRVGDLSPQHLPGNLPMAGSMTNLFGRGVFVDPPGAAFSPGLDIDVFDDLMLGGGNAMLYRLDSDTGEWLSVGVGSESGGRIQSAGLLTAGGLYAFGIGVPDRTVTGRVLDVDGDPVSDVMVRVDQRVGLTAGDGSFSVDFVPATLADGSTPRNAVIELFAGGSWLPTVAASTVAVSASVSTAAVDAGDLTLDTVLAGNIRVQQVVRARSDPFQPARYSSVDGDVGLLMTSDASGQAIFEDVPAGFFGFQEGRRRSDREVFYGQAVGFLEAGRRWLDNYQFLFDRAWFVGTRSNRGYLCDSIGGGPVRDVTVVEGDQANIGFLAVSRENGLVFAERGFRGRATATVRTSRDGQNITHGFSVELPNSDHLEFPLRRVLRTPLAAFDRHGLIAGDLTGASPTALQSIRATRRFTQQEWWGDIVDGLPVQSSLPVDVDPATTHLQYQVGMDASGGHVAAIEFLAPSGENKLQKMGVLSGYQAIEGALTQLDLPLDLVANTQFSLPGATTSVDPEIDLNTLDLALGLIRANGDLVDVGRDLDGSYDTVTPSALSFTLPALAGDLLNNQWLALLSGTKSTAGVTSSHASLVAMSSPSTPNFTFPEFPTLTVPAANASVSADGFTTSFTLPVGAIGGVVELRSPGTNDLLLWQVLVRPETTGFTFVKLPVEAVTPLQPGRTYTLTITAWFGTIEIESPNLFGDFASYAQTIGIIEAGVTQITRRSISITTV